MVADGRRIGQPEFDDFDEGFIDGAATKLDTLTLGEQFVYEFDFADRWTHLCTAAHADRPRDKLGIIPSGPPPHWEWETIPDQNGRRWADDDEEHDEPPNPGSDPLTSAAHDGAHNYRAKRPCRWQPRTVRTRLVRGR